MCLACCLSLPFRDSYWKWSQSGLVGGVQGTLSLCWLGCRGSPAGSLVGWWRASVWSKWWIKWQWLAQWECSCCGGSFWGNLGLVRWVKLMIALTVDNIAGVSVCCGGGVSWSGVGVGVWESCDLITWCPDPLLLPPVLVGSCCEMMSWWLWLFFWWCGWCVVWGSWVVWEVGVLPVWEVDWLSLHMVWLVPPHSGKIQNFPMSFYMLEKQVFFWCVWR